MLNNNFRKFLQLVTSESFVSMKGHDGTSVNDSQKSTLNSYHQNNGVFNLMKTGRAGEIVSSSAGVYFGTDSTPATMDDYTLGAVISSGLTVGNPSSVTRVQEGDKVTHSAAYTLTNTSGAEMSIYEIGLFWANVGQNNTRYSAMLDRTVLTKPITLAAGESKAVTYELSFRYSLSLE